MCTINNHSFPWGLSTRNTQVYICTWKELPLFYPNVTNITDFPLKDDRGHTLGEESVVKWGLETIFWAMNEYAHPVKCWQFYRLPQRHAEMLCTSGGWVRHFPIFNSFGICLNWESQKSTKRSPHNHVRKIKICLSKSNKGDFDFKLISWNQ